MGTALLAPVVLVGGWLIADALQPASYSPMRQTMSVLAGHAGTDRWVMTAALLLVGSCQIATGAGLTAVRMPERIMVILTGLSTLGIADTPEPATRPTPRHLVFAVSCVVTTAVWPVLVARRTPQSWILGARGCATATVIFAGLSRWLLIAAQQGGGDLGMVERLTAARSEPVPAGRRACLAAGRMAIRQVRPRVPRRFSPVGVTPTGLESGQCHTHRNADSSVTPDPQAGKDKPSWYESGGRATANGAQHD